ncbi:PREDICTED: aspartyl protease family protein At5g10770-like [Ipomoea nil]|uniref:aspartyl protease family protein At5g10770-like n=1 Tax=Ipomoea nil TaxID=35883 RepID=UPI000900EC58|nr:PREDICTED: aspartyl protease family protein At5g10770-like [Ipomoea nil]
MDFKNVVSATKSVSCSSFFLFLFTFYLSSFLAQAARNPPPPKEIYHVVNLSSLRPKPYCESPRTGSELGSGKIRMASRNGPCSPHNPAAKKMPSYGPLFQAENLANSDGSSAGYMEYIVTIELGTPKEKFTLLVDTGSDNTWVGCKPCNTGCGPNLFDPSKSSTYVNDSCRPSTDDQFNVTYGDNSKSEGYWGCDTLTIDKSYAVKNFQFGCGQEIQNMVDDNNDGILGLGRGDLSLPSQGGTNFQKFSYCLPKSNSKKGYLFFGNEAQAKSSSSKPQFTPLLSPPENLAEKYLKKSYYFVELIGMSVAGKRLDVAPSVFNSPGTIIDSGTSITQLPQEVYSALTTAFNQSMASKYPAAASKEMSELDTCYNVDTNSNVIVPAITLHFKGMSGKREIDVELRQSGIVILPESEPNLVCLGFAQQKDGGLAIIGNHQQRQMTMFFDLQGNSVGFGTNNCAE